MKGAGVTVATIPTLKAKVVATIILVVKVEIATPVVKAKEVTTTTLAIQIEVVEKKQRVMLPKLKMNVDRHGLLSGDLQKSFDAWVYLLCKVYLDDCHVIWLV